MLLIAAIADDDTGATDLAGMLASEGLRAIILPEDYDASRLADWSQSADAIIIGTASRSIARKDAYDRSYRAVKDLLKLDPKLIAVKYCSTFDSTSEGNIGASIDAAMDATGEPFTVALVALPSLGRTTYMGYHFVYDKLLSDSVLRYHPLHPMTNPHLGSHLQSQTTRQVGTVTYNYGQTSLAIKERLAQLQAEGVSIAVLDCVDEAHIDRNIEAIAELRLITGSSGWATALPQLWRRLGTFNAPAADLIPLRAAGGSGLLIVSGSCSEATRIQNRWMSNQANCIPIHLDAVQLLNSTPDVDAAVAMAEQTLSAGKTCLITTTQVCSAAELHAKAVSLGLDAVAAGERISRSLGSLVDKVLQAVSPKGLIIAGGDTASTLMRVLKLGGLRVGPTIEPGVPVCVALARPHLGIALKSGNFGSPDFFARASSAILNLPQGNS